jgi:DivIVA domain-containing protein
MEWFIAVVVVAILGVAAMAAAGGMGEMAKDPVRDTFRQDLPADRALNAADIQALRFGVTLRGYSMSQVDDLLDRLTREIADRDATISELSGDRADDSPPTTSERSRLDARSSGEHE